MIQLSNLMLMMISSLPWLTLAFVPFSTTITTTSSTVGSTTTRHHGRHAATTLSSSNSQSTTTRKDYNVLPIQVVSSMPPDLPANLRHSYYLLRHGQSTSNVEGIISSARTLAYSTRHGLTDLGVSQAQEAAPALLQLVQEEIQKMENQQQQVQQQQHHHHHHAIVFVSSPFARAKETAEACRDALSAELQQSCSNLIRNLTIVPDVVLQDTLVERHFGRLDGQELFTYAYVWPLDRFNVTHTAFEVESVAAVCHRVRQGILELEDTVDFRNHDKNESDDEEESLDKTTHYHVVLTSHADVLQITQLYAAASQSPPDAPEPLNVGEFSSFRFTNGEVRPMIVGSTAHLPEPAPLPPPVRGTFIP